MGKATDQCSLSAGKLVELLEGGAGNLVYVAVTRYVLATQHVLLERLAALNVIDCVRAQYGADLPADVEHEFDQVRVGVLSCQTCEFNKGLDAGALGTGCDSPGSAG